MSAPRRSTTALVTGATGFIGQHLIRKLKGAGVALRAMSRRQHTAPGVEWLAGDICDYDSVATASRDCDVVYHLAAAVPGSCGRTRMQATNAHGTANVVRACVANAVPRLVHVSSVAAYAPPLSSTVLEGHPLGGADSYGHSKSAAEKSLRARAGDGLACAILRPCQVYGEGDSSGYTQRLVALLSGRYAPVAGRIPRPFSLVHVDDVVDAIIAAGRSAAPGCRAYNVAGPEMASLHELLGYWRELSSSAARSITMPAALLRGAFELRWAARNLREDGMRPILKRYSAATVHGSLFLGGPEYPTQRARLELGYEPGVSVREGLQRLHRTATHRA